MTPAATPRPTRLSEKLRRAIDLRVTRGLLISDACRQAGLSVAGWHKAVKKPAVQAHMENVRQKLVAEADTRRGALRLEALEAAAAMLRDPTLPAPSKVRLLELLLSEGKSSAVNVQINAPQVASPADAIYTYRRPPQIAAPYLRTIEGEG